VRFDGLQLDANGFIADFADLQFNRNAIENDGWFRVRIEGGHEYGANRE
jgi:hypothetical protein